MRSGRTWCAAGERQSARRAGRARPSRPPAARTTWPSCGRREHVQQLVAPKARRPGAMIADVRTGTPDATNGHQAGSQPAADAGLVAEAVELGDGRAAHSSAWHPALPLPPGNSGRGARCSARLPNRPGRPARCPTAGGRAGCEGRRAGNSAASGRTPASRARARARARPATAFCLRLELFRSPADRAGDGLRGRTTTSPGRPETSRRYVMAVLVRIGGELLPAHVLGWRAGRVRPRAPDGKHSWAPSSEARGHGVCAAGRHVLLAR